jgi:hypothetical protein
MSAAINFHAVTWFYRQLLRSLRKDPQAVHKVHFLD